MSTLRALFEQVCDLPPAEREAALRASGADGVTIAQVLALLEGDASGTERVRQPLEGFFSQLSGNGVDAGDVLGAWRLLREIGRGGMGAVWLAERSDGHFRQQAAIKLIGGPSDPIAAARFARERQLLADLQHPQIARLLDGGAAADGQPYLVMEYIEGVPLDAWCRAHALDLPRRLALFASVCRTVQFAHRHLIAHCDLKPSNVLVREDGTPVLLDFGVARAVDRARGDASESTEPTAETVDARTAPGGDATALYLTPRYASPEQLRGERPTLACDIFSLGLMLYELATLQRPEREGGAVPRPGAATPPRLPRATAADLDAIVARACAADPAQRYGSAAALAEDVLCIGARRPVQARRGAAYVFTRLLQRRWPAFALGLAFVLTLGAFVWRTVAAEREARAEATTAQRTADFLVSVFAASDSDVNTRGGHELTAHDILDHGAARIDAELADEPRVRARLLEAMGHAYRHMNHGDQAAAMLRKAADLNLSPAVDQPVAAARCLEALTNAMANGEFPADAVEAVAKESLALAERVSAPDSQPVANAWMVLSLALNRAGKYQPARDAALVSHRLNERLPPPGHRRAPALHNLGMIHSNLGELDAALDFSRRGIAAGEPETAGNAVRMRQLAAILERRGEFDEALAVARQALDTGIRIHGADSAFAVDLLTSLARVQASAGNYGEALAHLDRALQAQERNTGREHGEYHWVQSVKAESLTQAGLHAQALPLVRGALAFRGERYAPDDPRVLASSTLLARILVDTGASREEARSLLDAVLGHWEAKGEAESFMALSAALALAQWQVQFGEPADANRLLDRLEPLRSRLDAFGRARLPRLRAELARRQGEDEAVPKFGERAWRELEQGVGAAHPHVARLALLHARDLRAAGEASRAGAIEARARAIVERGFPTGSRFRDEAGDDAMLASAGGS